MSEDDEWKSQDEEWELAPENCHQRAVSLLTEEFYWDDGDDNSPLGNDSGSDTFAQYREWRVEYPQSTPIEFLDKLLEVWEVSNENWDVIDIGKAEQLLEQDAFSLIARDDAIIGLRVAWCSNSTC